MGIFELAIHDICYCIETKKYGIALTLIDCLLVVERTKYGNV